MKKVIFAVLALSLFQSCTTVKLSPVDREELERLHEQRSTTHIVRI
jgi:hypothetical protein